MDRVSVRFAWAAVYGHSIENFKQIVFPNYALDGKFCSLFVQNSR